MTMPATTHELDHKERLRLMRSARKLEALLGETPLVVEASAPYTPSLSRSASMVSTESRRGGHLHLQTLPLALSPSETTRPTLFLSLPSPAELGTSTLSPLSPLSPTFSVVLNSPTTSTTPLASRRRKMAKLARTLGENVPPELVFPTTETNRRRASTMSLPAVMLERRDSMRSLQPSLAPTEDSAGYRRASFDTLGSHASAEYLLPPPPRRGDAGRQMHRAQQGWSGEWGGQVDSMSDVVRGLRMLKAK